MAAAAAEGAAATALRAVLGRAAKAAERSGRAAEAVRVVAVGKTKPVSMVRELYDAGHRCFGENYVQEFVTKAPQLPEDIRWHFIGHLQSNKVKSLLAAVPNLHMVEGVDNVKIANHLDRAVSSLGRDPLKVLVQVNTSGEESKSGIDPSRCVELAKHVKLACPHLIFSGLMTIGMKDYSSTPENFKALVNCKLEVCKAIDMPAEQFELSMGMSGDFEQAVASSMAGSEDLSGLTASLGELHVESSALKDSEISHPGNAFDDDAIADDDVWDDVSDSPGHGSTLDREWAHRQNQFHKMGYRDGIAEGQKDIAQEGFNVGFGQSVHVGYKWGLVRGITSALASLPDNLKEKMFPNVQCRGQLQDLNNSVQEISAEDALQMFHESILRSSHSSEEPDATLKRATDSSRLQSLSKDLVILLHECPDVKVSEELTGDS
uniref:Pyridoxal phosphate homeostasis protein n=1 Tax=Oryza rufipogon TaxID=4529 RepID=A0A0E0N7N2_ORYRU